MGLTQLYVLSHGLLPIDVAFNVESQAINVLHPRNRKLPTQLLATSHDNVSVGSKAPIKIANTTGYQEFTSQGLLKSPTENTGSQVRSGASRSETLKQE